MFLHSVYDCIGPSLQITVRSPEIPRQEQSTVRLPTAATPLPDTVDRVCNFCAISPRIVDIIKVAEQSDLQKLVLSRINS